MSDILLKKIKLENFKCYKNTTIKFKEISIIVGENNAGKSCLVESLRLVSVAGQNASRKYYVSIPGRFGLPIILKGFSVDCEKLKIDLKSIVYFYEDKYAKVTAYFSDKSTIEIYLDKNGAFALVYDSEGNNIKDKKKAKQFNFDKIGILPQIGLIKETETPLTDATIVQDKDTYLSSRHFRNEILHYKKEYFPKFKELAEATWPGLQIDDIKFDPFSEDFIKLFIKDNNFPAEIGRMGSGIQMWLQIIWFLAKTEGYFLIILDEPDVYMHADLQRKILDIVKTRYPQIIIATHSLEIISRVDPENILEILKKDKAVRYANDSKSVQSIIDDIGGAQNLSLLRLGRARKCLFVEGYDLDYLNKFNEVLYGSYLDIPNIAYGGFSKISELYGAAKLMHSETDNAIKCFAIADKDYRDEKIVLEVINKAQASNLELHIWKKKEIENYILSPKVLFRMIPEKFKITYEEFILKLDELVEQYKDSVIDNVSQQYSIDSKILSENGNRWDNIKCNQMARAYVNKYWDCLDNKLSLVGGKEFFSVIAKYFQETFKISITKQRVLKNFSRDEIDPEIVEVLSALNSEI